MQYDVDNCTDSDSVKAAARVFGKIDNGKDGILPSSNFVDSIEILGGGFHSEDLAVHLRKLEPN